jgi:hypothetical protein
MQQFSTVKIAWKIQTVCVGISGNSFPLVAGHVQQAVNIDIRHQKL